MEIIKTTVRHLEPGDVTLGSGWRIERISPVIRDAKGYFRNVDLVDREGHTRRTSWNASTTMRVERDRA